MDKTASNGNPTGWQIIFTNCPTLDNAQRIARALVTEGHAGAVNVLPEVRSTYKWQGKLHSAQERLVVIKARTKKYSQIEQRIRAHPYELPAIVAVPIAAGLEEYLEWLSCQD